MSEAFEFAVAVLEPEPHWVPLLKKYYLHESVYVRGCRDLGEAVREVVPRVAQTSVSPASGNCVAILDLSAGSARCLEWLRAAQQHFLSWPILAHGSSRERELEWVFREAGLTSFRHELPSVTEMTRWINQQRKLCMQRSERSLAR